MPPRNINLTERPIYFGRVFPLLLNISLWSAKFRHGDQRVQGIKIGHQILLWYPIYSKFTKMRSLRICHVINNAITPHMLKNKESSEFSDPLFWVKAQQGAWIKWNFWQGLFKLPEHLAKNIHILICKTRMNNRIVYFCSRAPGRHLVVMRPIFWNRKGQIDLGQIFREIRRKLFLHLFRDFFPKFFKFLQSSFFRKD